MHTRYTGSLHILQTHAVQCPHSLQLLRLFFPFAVQCCCSLYRTVSQTDLFGFDFGPGCF